MSGMRKFEAFLDDSGSYLAGKSSIIVIPTHAGVSLLTLLGILNSTLMRFYVQDAYGVLGVDGGISFSGKMIESLPLPFGFGGKIETIEKATLSVLDCLQRGGSAMEEIQELNNAVFAEYGISSEFRQRIRQTELRC